MGGVQSSYDSGSQTLANQKKVTLSANSSATTNTTSEASASQEQSSAASETSSSAASEQGSSAAASQSSSAVKSGATSVVVATSAKSSAASSTQAATSSAADKQASASSSSASESSASASAASSDESTQTVKVSQLLSGESVLPISALGESKAVDLNAETVTVDNAKDLYDAIYSGKATTINVAGDINLGSQVTSFTGEGGYGIRNKRDIVIQAAYSTAGKPTIDFGKLAFTMGSNNSVTFKNLNLEGQSWFGLVQSAGTYNFDNIDYQGSQMVYSTRNTVINFSGTNSAKTVNSYANQSGDKVYVQGISNDNWDNPQQLIEIRNFQGTVNFKSGSNNNLTTVSGNVVQIDGNGSAVNVENGAQVTLNPHSGTNVEGANGGQVQQAGGVARGLYINNNSQVNVSKGATLTINSGKRSGDKYATNGIYAGNSSVITNDGNLIINSDGDISTKQNWTAPIYLWRTATINNRGTLRVNATNLGSYHDALIKFSGRGTINLSAHSTFDVSGDGTGEVTGVALASGSTFTSDQPDSFKIDLSSNTNSNKSLIKNGTIDFTRVKTLVDGTDSAPLKEAKITYNNSGVPSVDTITGQSKDSVNSVAGALTNSANYRNAVNFSAAGSDVNVDNISLDATTDKLTGHVTSSDSTDPIYIKVTIKEKDGNTTIVPVTVNRTDWTKTGTATPTSSTTPFQATADADGNFTVDLSSLTLPDDDTIDVTADQNYVNSTSQSLSVALIKARQCLKDAINAAKQAKAGAKYLNDTSDKDTTDPTKTTNQAALDNELTSAESLLNSTTATSAELSNAANVLLKTDVANLNGKATDTTDLQNAVTSAGTNNPDALADSKKTTPTTTLGKAIKAAQTVIDNAKAYSDALTAANNDPTKVNTTTTPFVTQAAVDTAKKALTDAESSSALDQSKAALQDAITAAKQAKNSGKYNNESDDTKKSTFDTDYTTATGLTDSSDLDAIKSATIALTSATKALTGGETSVTVLQTAITNADKNSDAVADAAKDNPTTDLGKALKAAQGVMNRYNAYQQALSDAKGDAANVDVSKTTYVSQSDVNTATTNLNNALQAADDAATLQASKQELQDAVNAAPAERQKAEYYNATDDAKDKYDQAINDGQKVLDEVNPTKQQLDNALNAINAAKGNLKGQDTNKSALSTDINDAATQKTEPNYTSASADKKAAYDDAISNGQTVLNNSNATQKQVDDAVTAINNAKNGLDGNANVTALNNAKTAAKDDIEAAKNAKIADIKAAPALTYDEKTKLINQADTEAQKANDNIDKAKTPTDVSTAKTNGVNAIEGITVPTASEAKDEAITAINNALDAKNKAIDDAPALTDDEKANLKQQASDAAASARDAVKDATTDADVNQARTDGVKHIHDINVPTTSAVKDAANQAIKDALKSKDDQIDANSGLTNDEKNDLKSQAKAAASTAKSSIDKATTNDGVAGAKAAGITAIDNVTAPSQTAKDKAKADVNVALTAKNNAIDAASALTNDEKQALKDQAQNAANTANDNIDAATTNADVNTAKTAGVNAIDDITVPTTSAAKDAANKAIDDAVKAKKNQIAASGLTDEEKAGLNSTVDNDATAAKQAIANATTDAAVTTAKNSGVQTINNINVPKTSTVKTDADKAIDDAVKAKKDQINASTTLTQDEKKGFDDQVDAAAKTAKDNIAKASTNADVATAQKNGVDAINNINVPDASQSKTDAKKAIDDAQTAKDKQIDGNKNLTDDEKTALKNRVKNAADSAKDAIDKANTNDDVAKAQNAGKAAIQNIPMPSTSAAKDAAINAIDDAATAKKNQINASKALIQDEKKALDDQVDGDANQAKDAINNATTNAAVKAAQDDGVTKINNIQVPTQSKAKTDAINHINSVLKNKTDQINGSASLTNDEKAALVQKANNAANSAKDAINNAQTNAGVTAAENKGVSDINGITIPTLDQKKDTANKAIDDALNNKKSEIKNAKNLSSDEQKKLIQDATNAANNDKDNINNATNADGVNKAESDGLNDIHNVKVPSLDDKKADAKSSIDNAQKAKDDQIDNTKNLTPAEKTDLKKKVQDAADTAKSNIDKATNDTDVKNAETTGISNISNVNIPSLNDRKNQAKGAIEDARAKKQAEINNAVNLTPAEKYDLNNQLQKDVDDANNNIDAATDDTGVNNAEQDGLNNINGIKVPSVADKQNDAKAAIDAAKKAKDDEIDHATNISDSDKTSLKKKVDDAANDAKKAIDQAGNDAAVQKAQDDGIAAINGVNVPNINDLKKAADEAIKNALTKKQNEINSSNLPQNQKDDLNKKAQDTADQAKANIADASTNDAVADAQKAGVKAIEDINVPTIPVNPGKTLDQQKSDANKAIDDALAKKQNEINNSNLPQPQKDDLNKQAQDAADAAKDNINKATNAGDVTKAQNDGVKAIDDINVPSTPVTPVNPGEVLAQHKADADKTIDKALADKQNEINSSNLPQNQKDDLNQQATNAANAAKDNIAKATTADDVSNAVFNGVQAINDVKVPSASEVLDQQKSDANKQIDDALSQKTDEINNDNSLNDEQKSQLINKADDLANQAKDAINNASDASAVEQALNQGLANIKNLSSADIETNNNHNNGGNNSGNQNGNSGSLNNNNGSIANNGAAGELNGNAGAANANGANVGIGVANDASLNNSGLSAMAHAVKNANASANTNANGKKLPQTGNNKDEALGLMGLAAAGLIGMFGAAKGDKKED